MSRSSCVLVLAALLGCGPLAAAGEQDLSAVEYRQYSADRDYYVRLTPPSKSVPGYAVCYRSATGEAVWMADVYSPRVALANDGKGLVVWSGLLASADKGDLAADALSLYYEGKAGKSIAAADLFAAGKRDLKLMQRPDGKFDWLKRTPVFLDDDQTVRLFLANDAVCDVNVRTGAVTTDASAEQDPAVSPGYQLARNAPPVAESIDRVSSGFFQAFAAGGAPAGNLVYSPYVSTHSFINLSGMAAGETREEINRALGLRDELAKADAAKVLKLGRGLKRSPDLVSATGLWYAGDFTPHKEFQEQAADQGVALFPFTPNQAKELPKSITDWLKQRLAPTPVDFDGSDLAESPRFVLVNATSFRERWKNPFNETPKLTFHFEDGKTDRVPSVRGDQTIRVLALKDRVKLGSIPFEDERCDLVVLIPDGEEAKLAGVVALVQDRARLDRALAELDLQKKESYSVELPVLNLRKKLDLKTASAAMGVKTLFDSDKASFAGAFDAKGMEPLKFQARQTVTFDLDQYGVSAAAVEVNSAGTIGFMNSFRVNRPFVFILRDRVIGCDLFVGCVTDPRAP